LAQATLVVSPRIHGRNTPMKVFSYLASGRPLLATRLPTHTQVLGDDIAMLVEPTPEGMAEGLRRLFDDPALGRRLADTALARARAEFTRAAFTRKLTGFYDAHVAPGPKRPSVADAGD